MADQLALGPSSEPLGAASNPMHVVSRPEPIKGWPGLQSDVEGFDKQEIEGHKDDIDTLLVFTGLFSAVLAAFVLIAYTLLEPDAAGATLSVVTQMSTQGASYHVEGDFINSTTPATPPPPFEPTYNAIVVNDLWTASLIISLATASFAILVKQWLRQYIKYTTSFPQGRMRVRHFRREGLERWYVLEIAAFLPFLLQVSLALFFVGLCYFTADVHPSVRNTTLPLVCGWAFLFIAATIFPIFSAQCPYKTPALDGLTTFLRDLLWSMWTGIMKHLAAVQWQPSPTILLRLVGIVRRWADRQHMRLTNMTFSRNEDAASKSDSADFAILLNADKLHGNDEVVDTAISHAIQQSKIKWEDAIELVQQLILNRLPSQDMFSGHPKIVELGDLTPRALMAVHNILDYTESFHAATLEYPWGPVPFLESVSAGKKPECWVFFLRLSVSLVQPPTTLPRWLDRSNWDDCRTLGEICQPSKSAQVLQSLLALLCRRLERPDFNLSTPLPRLQAFLEVYFDELHVPDSFGAEQPRPWSDVLNAESLGPTIAWLTQQLKSDIATPPAGPSDVRSHETLWGDTVSLIVKLMAVAEDTSVFDDIPPVAVKSSEILGKFWISCFNYRLHMSRHLVPLSGLDGGGLSNIKTTITALASDFSLDGENALKLCMDLCWSLWNDRGDVRAANLVSAWLGVFDALTQLVQRTQVEDSDAAMRLVNWCFSRIEDFDGINNSDDDAKYTEWLATFNPEDSPIPDEFISALLRINPDARYGGWRVRRLKEISAEDKRSAGGEVKPQPIDSPLVTSVSEEANGQSQSHNSKPAAANQETEVNVASHSPGDADGVHMEDRAELEIYRGDASVAQSPVTRTELANVCNAVHEYHMTLELATASQPHDNQNPSAHLNRPVQLLHPSSSSRQSEQAPSVRAFPGDTDDKDHESTDCDDVLRTQADTVDDSLSEAAIDAATRVPDVTSSLPPRDEEQEPLPRVPDITRYGSPPLLPDIVVPDSSLQDANLDHGNGGHSSAAATSGVVPEATDTLAEPAADNSQTGLSGAVASTHEPSSYRTQNDIGLSPASTPPESVPAGFPDIYPSVVTDGQQTRDSTSASGIFSVRGVGDVEGTRNDGQTFDAVHSEHGRGAVRDDDGLQFLDGGDDVIPREGVEDEEDT